MGTVLQQRSAAKRAWRERSGLILVNSSNSGCGGQVFEFVPEAKIEITTKGCAEQWMVM